ncbi:ribonuclease T2-like [Loxospora ochrophaea]|nr:ribonuclease T2-like [Loxospora ochrophaea]
MPSAFSSIGSLASLALKAANVALISSGNGVSAGAPATCKNPQLSCHNTSAVADTCCFNAPGGQLLQTQFWDTDPSTGPTDSWTIHGLWPDLCDGSYQEDCDPSRAYKNITAILESYGKTSLLSYMNEYWVNDPDDGSNEEFWEHEWETHGTCISTFDTDCYTDYTPQEEVVDFFQDVVNLFQTLDSYQTLASANIVPSSSKTYTSKQIAAALGPNATFNCDGKDLDEIYYFFDVKGSVQTGEFVPTLPIGESSDCPSTGIKYLPKSG